MVYYLKTCGLYRPVLAGGEQSYQKTVRLTCGENLKAELYLHILLLIQDTFKMPMSKWLFAQKNHSYEASAFSTLMTLHTCFLNKKTPRASPSRASHRAVSDMSAHEDFPDSHTCPPLGPSSFLTYPNNILRVPSNIEFLSMGCNLFNCLSY